MKSAKMDVKDNFPQKNFNHLETIHKECIRKERKYELTNLKKEFTFSAYNCNIVIIISFSHNRKANKNYFQ